MNESGEKLVKYEEIFMVILGFYKNFMGFVVYCIFVIDLFVISDGFVVIYE